MREIGFSPFQLQPLVHPSVSPLNGDNARTWSGYVQYTLAPPHQQRTHTLTHPHTHTHTHKPHRTLPPPNTTINILYEGIKQWNIGNPLGGNLVAFVVMGHTGKQLTTWTLTFNWVRTRGGTFLFNTVFIYIYISIF
jgi:hypothetical protein